MNIEYYKNKYEPIDGKWYITKKLGSGAFGTVFEVERRDQTNMKAAVKIIEKELSQFPKKGKTFKLLKSCIFEPDLT